jgi:succinate dehydrogenase flavin-adding protein (antitoxin of CptAB toxin-antitoxin module)
MTVQKAIEQFREHQKATVKEKTINSYKRILNNFQNQFYDRMVNQSPQRKSASFWKTILWDLVSPPRDSDMLRSKRSTTSLSTQPA